MVPADPGFCSSSAIHVLSLSHPAAQQSLRLISSVSPRVSLRYTQLMKVFEQHVSLYISEYVSFAYISLNENLRLFLVTPTSFKALQMLLHCFLGLSVLGKYEGSMLFS